MKGKISYEVFPPKITDGIEHIYGCLEGLSKLSPEYISVTYSAGNAKKGLTAEVCETIQKKYGIKAVSHLTCTGATKESIISELRHLKSLNVDTILALRGDITPEKQLGEYKHAVDLMKEINRYGGFNLCSACYPEGHVESGNLYEELSVLKAKYELGTNKFISQLFFKNETFMKMYEAGKRLCPKADFCAGVMPVMSAPSLIRMVNLSGATLSEGIKEIINKYESDKIALKQAGLDYAIKQIRELIENGCQNIHLYTMDNASATETIYNGIKDLIETNE